MKIKKILISQPAPNSQKSPYSSMAEKYGLDIDFRPFIKNVPLPAKEFRQEKISFLDFTAVIFKTRLAIENYFRLCKEMRVSVPENMKYFCKTEQVALYLQKFIVYRKRKVFFPETGQIEDLKKLIKKHSDERYLFALNDVHNDDIRVFLDETSIKYKKAVLYRTVSNDFKPDEKFDYDMMVLFSPNGLNSFIKSFPNFEQGDLVIATLGNKTAVAVEKAGLKVNIKAPSPEFPSISAAIEQYIKENHKNSKKK